jgi:hypothetical protein
LVTKQGQWCASRFDRLSFGTTRIRHEINELTNLSTVLPCLPCRCKGCQFQGTRSKYEEHLGSTARKPNQNIYLEEEHISLKVST